MISLFESSASAWARDSSDSSAPVDISNTASDEDGIGGRGLLLLHTAWNVFFDSFQLMLELDPLLPLRVEEGAEAGANLTVYCAGHVGPSALLRRFVELSHLPVVGDPLRSKHTWGTQGAADYFGSPLVASHLLKHGTGGTLILLHQERLAQVTRGSLEFTYVRDVCTFHLRPFAGDDGNFEKAAPDRDNFLMLVLENFSEFFQETSNGDPAALSQCNP